MAWILVLMLKIAKLKLIKLKSLATPHDREEVDRIETEIMIKIEGE